MARMRRSCLLLPLLLTPVFAAPADFLPPALPWHGASEAVIAKPDNPWITPAERTGLTDSPGYDDTLHYLEKLCAASPLLKLQVFGRTPEGRDLYLVVASKEGAATPTALAANGRPTLLAQAGIHSGEIDGKDAGLMLLRDIAFGGKAALLDGANLLFIPVLNADGHERSSEWSRPNQRGPVHMGWRTNAQNLNLNRDYMKADTAEMRALLTVLNTWSPSLYFDIHVTDGLDYQYDVALSYHGFAGMSGWSPRIGTWLDQTFYPSIAQSLRAEGHLPVNYYISERDSHDLTKGLDGGRGPARFSHAYGDLRHLPTLLVETHSLKPYRQRVLCTYALLTSTLELLAREKGQLAAAAAADRATRPAEVPLTWIAGGPQMAVDFLGVEYELYQSPASGEREVRWLGRPKTYEKLPLFLDRVGAVARRPSAYWVPVTKPEVIDRLKLHGIRMETLAAPRTVAVTQYRIVDPQPLPTEGAYPFEGRATLKFGVRPEDRSETFPAGSVRVSTDQPLGDLAIALLEPEGADSFMAWGFFGEILKRTEYIEGYVVAPMADKMLVADPILKAEFEAKLAAEPKFAGDPKARLQWFYQRSKFYDDRYLLYPVGIER